MWLFLGIFYLVWLTWQDYKHKMVVDDRKNYFMFGVTTALLDLFKIKWYFIFIIFTVFIILFFIFSKYKVLGNADLKSLLWIFYGFAIIKLSYLALFAILFIIVLILNELIKRFVLRLKMRVRLPFYHVILISFILTIILSDLFYLKP
jgi:hypothetical protein